MATYHLEEYVYLAGLTHKSAVIAWGGFFFKIKGQGTEFKLVDESVIQHLVKAYFIPGHVRVAFCGHDHNFQATHTDGLHCFVTGAGGKIDPAKPERKRFESAHVRAWGGKAHFSLVKIEGEHLSVRPIAAVGPGGLVDMPLEDAEGRSVPTPIRITLQAP